MWEVEVSAISKYVNECNVINKVFSSKQDALDYCNKFKDKNCNIYLENLDSNDNSSVCLQEAKY